MLASVEKNPPEEIREARRRLDHMNVPPVFQYITELERTMLDIDEQLNTMERQKEGFLQKRAEILREVRQVTDQVVEARLRKLMANEQLPLGGELSLEREILHAFFDNPLQSFLHGFGVEELVQNIFRINDETDLKDYRQAQEWQSHILRFLQQLDIVSGDETGERFFFFPFE